MKFINISSLDELPATDNNVNYERFTKYLFCGTRRWFIEHSDNEREKFINDCKDVVSFAKSNLCEIINVIESEELKNFLCRSAVLNGYGESRQYEYGDFYVTANFVQAIHYSFYDAGELADCAYRLASLIVESRLSNDDCLLDSCKSVISQYNIISASDSIVLAINDVKYEDLLTMSGDSYCDRHRNHLEDTIAFLYEENVHKRGTDDSFRLKNLSYTAYCIPTPLYKAGMVKLTEINDADEFISNDPLSYYLQLQKYFD